MKTALRELRENLKLARLVELIDSFLDTTPPLIGSMRTSINAGDFRAASWSAHTATGSFGSLGMRRIEASMRELEPQPRAGSREIPAAALDRIREQFEAGCAILREHRQRLIQGVKEPARSELHS